MNFYVLLDDTCSGCIRWIMKSSEKDFQYSGFGYAFNNFMLILSLCYAQFLIKILKEKWHQEHPQKWRFAISLFTTFGLTKR